MIRITKEDCDITTPEGAKRAEQIARENPGALLLTSLPCTAGCTWWHINVKRPGGKARLRMHRRILRQMLEAWLPVARAVMESNGCIAWEWPRSCALWRERRIQDIMREFGLAEAFFDGCAFGVKCQSGRNKGLPIRKPWVMAANCPSLFRNFHG